LQHPIRNFLSLSPATELHRASFLLLGPTAVGKSELAVALAERFDGEIIGADAFQVYDGLERLTAKPDTSLLARVPHHLIGEVPLRQRWDVAQWLAAARDRIAAIAARGRMAIVVGGTGLYVRALTRGLAELPPASAELRAELEAIPLTDLTRRLAELDPECARRIDLHNPRRVVRALEVCLLTGEPYSQHLAQWKKPVTGWRGVVLTREREELYERIDRRTEAMFAAGVIEEVRALGEIGATASQTLGLREIRAHLAGGISGDECVAAIRQATRQYAKRQLTWFRRETAFRTLNLSDISDPGTLIDQLILEARSD
jgi:tRNA dimethylallyltransferase